MYDISTYIYSCGFESLTQKGRDWNFKCPVCGDSKKSSKKKRGWIFWSTKNNNYIYYCHNCLLSISFYKYLQKYQPDVFQSYIKDNFKKKRKNNQIPPVKSKPKNIITYEKLDLPTLYSLENNHIAKTEFLKRKLPLKYLKYCYYTDRFFEWINQKIPDKFEKDDFDDPRIVIPFYTENRKIFGVSGRSLNPKSNLRYITIKFDEEQPKIFGLERIKKNQIIYITEGQFDSFFIPNCIACGGASIPVNSLLEIAPKENFVFIMDNEPRNKEICKRIEKIIDLGFKISLFPYKYKKYGKDINDLIISGLTRKEIYNIINNNIYFEMKAKIHFKIWKKTKS